MEMKQSALRAAWGALLVLLASSASASGGTLWDAGSDFSLTSNPNGQWSYGFETTLGGALTGFTVAATAHGLDAWATATNYPGEEATAYVGHNPTASTITYTTFSIPPNALQLHPGPAGQYAVVRWTSPFVVNTLVTVDGSFFSEDDHTTPTPAGTTTDVHIFRNGVSLLDSNINGTAATSPFSLTLAVGAADTIDFAVGFGSNMDYKFDSTGLHAHISDNPEPGTWVLLLSGVTLGLLNRRRPL
jgi:hypothetical protein